ncbi:MAG TPA: DUF4124 domain-containing protein [Pseudogulbenkiania sp.]|nr:DUF4124 domain-containing protein [Pseudogulbenkiania sp.]
MKHRWWLCTFILLSLPVLAEVYTWKDAAGRTVFSDQPPPGQKASRLDVRVPPAPLSPAKADASAPAAKAGDKANDKTDLARQAEELNRKIRAENCLRAKSNLSGLQLNGRIRLPGSNALASDTQRNEMIRQSEQDVATWCK